MKRKRIERVLKNKVFYIILVVFTIFWFLINTNSTNRSNLKLGDGTFEGKLTNLVVKSNKVSFTIESTEKLICNLYLNDEHKNLDFRKLYPLGSIVSIKGELTEPLNNTIPNTFNYKKYLKDHGIFYICSIDDLTIINDKIETFYKIKNWVINRIMTFGIKDYMYTLIIGDKSLLDEETFEGYRKNGVTHLFAISGMHISLFSVVVMYLLKRLKIGKNHCYILTIILIWFYAFLTGFSSSVLRASLLFSLISLFKIFKLEVDTLNVLILTGCILILVNYRIILDIGFIYSFITTFGIIYSKDLIKKHKILGTSLVATLYSLPVTIQNFYKINFLSIFLNIIFVPIVSMVIYPLCMITFVFRFLEPITKMSIFFLELLNKGFSSIELFTIVVPKMNFVLVIVYYVLLIYKGKKILFKTSFILFVSIIIWKVKPYMDNNYYIEFLDVGQGDSTLIRSPNSKEIILIDTGGKEYFNSESSYHVASNTISYLNSLGLDRIDLLILSHGDFDHLGDASYLIENMNVKSIMLNQGNLNEHERELLDTGVDMLKGYNGLLDLEFFNKKDWSDENSNSIITLLKIYGNRFLFMGDATKEVEKYVIENEKLNKADIIKLGHHGSKTSSDKDFLKKIGAKIGIISSGRNNRYNHPNKETLDTLDSLKIAYYNTQYDGTITYKINKKSVTVKTNPP